MRARFNNGDAIPSNLRTHAHTHTHTHASLDGMPRLSHTSCLLSRKGAHTKTQAYDAIQLNETASLKCVASLGANVPLLLDDAMRRNPSKGSRSHRTPVLFLTVTRTCHQLLQSIDELEVLTDTYVSGGGSSVINDHCNSSLFTVALDVRRELAVR
jgi:hypothetical protein